MDQLSPVILESFVNVAIADTVSSNAPRVDLFVNSKVPPVIT